MGAWSKSFADYKTKYFGRRYKSTKSTYFRWIATDWYKFCKHPLTCFRIFFADFLVHTVKLKPIIKAQIPGKLVTSGISDVAIASVHSEKTRLKNLIMIIILLLVWINRKNWRFFTGARNWLPLWIKGQKSDGRLQIWCSIQLSLHKEPPEVGLVKKLTGSLY